MVRRIESKLGDVTIKNLGKEFWVDNFCVHSVDIMSIYEHQGILFVRSKLVIQTESIEIHITGKYQKLKNFIRQLDLYIPVYDI